MDGQRADAPARAVIVGVALSDVDATAASDSLDELAQLTTSAGAGLVGRTLVRRARPDPAYFIGRGKVDEIRQLVAENGADAVVFDVPLSPGQQRNLERALGIAVLDRTALILNIFAQRAQSREGKLQVELARLEHLSTRLVRGWTHLERQRGGLGKTGGPGEKQIELDRRQIAQRVKLLRERLKTLQRQRRTQRRARLRCDVFTVSLVGYTNAGKSTLFNALTRAQVLAADQLFATLDTTVRRCYLDGAGEVVLSDTVGFIRGLPHQLVAAFKSTLEESVQADLLLHVVDAAAPARQAHIEVVQRVLTEIGADHVPQLLVFNKIDRLPRAPAVERDPYGTIHAVFVSAATGLGLQELRAAIVERLMTARSTDAVAEAVIRTELAV
ncbi:MAG: GTPase HflX [Sutterellaceae bacterium]|nr:GTPase HflX [Burkholderiaceae bacterium]MDW8429067.1 GTPase HflX [Sutterellaceae bacterium]